MNTTTLENIGLTKNQAQVYLSLLKLGSTTAQEIIKESKIHRSPVYDALDKLEEKGLISSVIKDFKKYFQAASPKNLYTYLEEKKQELTQAMPELEKLEEMKKEEINASIYKGKEGLKTIFTEMLKEKKELLVLGGKGHIFTELKYFIPHFDKERTKKGLKWKILSDNEKAKKKHEKLELVEEKTLPKELNTNCVINLYGNKTAIILWNEKHPTAFVINNKDVTETFKKYFEFIYKHT